MQTAFGRSAPSRAIAARRARHRGPRRCQAARPAGCCSRRSFSSPRRLTSVRRLEDRDDGDRAVKAADRHRARAATSAGSRGGFAGGSRSQTVGASAPPRNWTPSCASVAIARGRAASPASSAASADEPPRRRRAGRAGGIARIERVACRFSISSPSVKPSPSVSATSGFVPCVFTSAPSREAVVVAVGVDGIGAGRSLVRRSSRPSWSLSISAAMRDGEELAARRIGDCAVKKTREPDAHEVDRRGPAGRSDVGHRMGVRRACRRSSRARRRPLRRCRVDDAGSRPRRACRARCGPGRGARPHEHRCRARAVALPELGAVHAVRAAKKSVPSAFGDGTGEPAELAGAPRPGPMSFTSTVPAPVPSLFQSSAPREPSLPRKKSVPLASVRVRSSSRAGGCSSRATVPARRSRRSSRAPRRVRTRRGRRRRACRSRS